MIHPTIERYHYFDGLKYFQSSKLKLGSKPELIVVSGIHGDEQDVIPELFLLLSKYQDILPSFVYVPVLSLIACAANTRGNPDGEDLNRVQDQSPLPLEAQRAQAFIRLFGPARMLLSVHQDYDLTNETYLYGEGKNIALPSLNRWRRGVYQTGKRPLANFDDKNDPLLRMLAKDGYIRHDKSIETPQMFESWAVNAGLVDQALTLEIPSKSTRRDKYQLLEAGLELVKAA